MGFVLTSNPQFIYKQTTTPDVIAGGFWYKTDTKEFFTSDGVSWTSLSLDVGFLNDFAIQTALEVLQLQAAGTITSGQEANIIRDIFTDSNGYLNTISANGAWLVSGAMTNNADSADKSVTHTTNINTQGESQSGKSGIEIHVNVACKLKSITFGLAGTNATRGILANSSKANIATATIVGGVATFSPMPILEAGVHYFLACDNSGAAFNNKTPSVGVAFPDNNTEFNYVGGLNWNEDTGTGNTWWFNVISAVVLTMEATYGEAVIETSKQDLTSTPSNFSIYAHNASTTGTSSITADISFDNGAHYQEDIALNTTTAITDAGADMILKLNLLDGASHNLASCKGYGVLFW